MQALVHGIDRISVVSGRILAWWTLLAVTIISYEVVARYVFDRPTNWAHESMTLIFAMQYVLCGAYAHYTRSHVRVDVVYQSLSPRNQARLDALTALLFFFYLGIMTYTGWKLYWDSQLMWEVSFTDWAPPMYPVKFTVFLGSLLLLLQGFANFVRDVAFGFFGIRLA
ncbi:MAG TPA: TRAP transporter small permease subunit [Methylomirabilota bacterium]|jgi:TRAP-type mannitol/chloroaromatic compound transport system permease small subunit